MHTNHRTLTIVRSLCHLMILAGLVAGCGPAGLTSSEGGGYTLASDGPSTAGEPYLPLQKEVIAMSTIQEECVDSMVVYLAGEYDGWSYVVDDLGGVPLREAVCSLDPTLVEDVTGTAIDPLGPSWGDVTVLAHPDVAVPGSDGLLYCVVDTETAEILATFHFN